MTFARIYAVALLTPSLRSIPFRMVVGIGLLAACSGDNLVLPGDGGGPTDSGGPTAIRVVDGDGQQGQVGELLAAPVVVEVTDAEGLPVEGATVVFGLTSAGEGAEISPSTATTSAAGQAEARLLLGDKVGLQTGEAHLVVGGDSVTKTSFTALADPANPDNRPPRADYNWHCEDLSCQFTDASTDDDGSVTAWSWRFGDNGTSNESDPAHLYPAPGTYLVTLTVTDNDGATDEATAHVDVHGPSPESNEPPDAEFEVDCNGLTCSFTDESEDDDGTLVSWFWDFGDGTGSSEQNPIHSYGEEDKYEVTLTVTDNLGATDTKRRHADAKEDDHED